MYLRIIVESLHLWFSIQDVPDPFQNTCAPPFSSLFPLVRETSRANAILIKTNVRLRCQKQQLLETFERGETSARVRVVDLWRVRAPLGLSCILPLCPAACKVHCYVHQPTACPSLHVSPLTADRRAVAHLPSSPSPPHHQAGTLISHFDLTPAHHLVSPTYCLRKSISTIRNTTARFS